MRTGTFDFICTVAGCCLIVYCTAVFIPDSLSISGIRGILASRSGESVALPPDIYDAVHLVQKHNLAALRVSPAIEKNPFLSQRMVEGIYPVRVQPQSANLIAFIKESVSGDCIPVEQTEKIVLYRCAP